jgi:hypothetical protein
MKLRIFSYFHVGRQTQPKELKAVEQNKVINLKTKVSDVYKGWRRWMKEVVLLGFN